MCLNRKTRIETTEARPADDVKHRQQAGLYSFTVDPGDQEDCDRLKR